MVRLNCGIFFSRNPNNNLVDLLCMNTSSSVYLLNIKLKKILHLDSEHVWHKSSANNSL